MNAVSSGFDRRPRQTKRSVGTAGVSDVCGRTSVCDMSVKGRGI